MNASNKDPAFVSTDLPKGKVALIEKAMVCFAKDEEAKRREEMMDKDMVPGGSGATETAPEEYTHESPPSARQLRGGPKPTPKAGLPGAKKRGASRKEKGAKNKSPAKKDKNTKRAKAGSDEEKPPSVTSEAESVHFMDKEGVEWDGPIFIPSIHRMDEQSDEDPVYGTTVHPLTQLRNRGEREGDVHPSLEDIHHCVINLITDDKSKINKDTGRQLLQYFAQMMAMVGRQTTEIEVLKAKLEERGKLLCTAIEEHPSTKDVFVLRKPNKRNPQFRVSGVDPDILPAELLMTVNTQNEGLEILPQDFHHHTMFKEKSGNVTHIFEVTAAAYPKIKEKSRLRLGWTICAVNENFYVPRCDKCCTPNPATSTTKMVSEMEVAMSMGDNMASTLSIGSFGGRTCIEVHGEDITPKKPKAGRPPASTSSRSWPARKTSRPKTKASFAKRVAASVTKAARMPIDIPKEDTKIVMPPRGGFNVARTEEEARADTICTNAQQNIIVVSTPYERRATLYSKVKDLNIGGRTYEVSAYRTAPDGTVKGVIRGIAVDDTPEEIAENIVNPYNPLAVKAHRIGNTTTVIVLFVGQKVPNYVKYGSILVRCGLYRKQFDVCKQCGKVGHKRDVCPNPNTRVCFGCGIANPSEGHERECKPKCKLCGGQHSTGERKCKNKYKMPYVVKKRQWERKMEAMQQQPDPESFPPPRAPSVERPREKPRQRDSSHKRDNSKRGRSASRHRPSQSRERAAWANAVKANMAEKRQPPAQNAAKKIQEENGVVKALRR
ncbi:hypothetical protein HPB47_006618 [Ixodes persulcatus]|uniref:Uncharacterized protein n=1 Tax=Ixodes persulcatus TaxID=34615 RepID=A0AC60PAE1_IXOPE|nr:hypothetical protein HPB47_006618 [Ixodes persulcatus]